MEINEDVLFETMTVLIDKINSLEEKVIELTEEEHKVKKPKDLVAYIAHYHKKSLEHTTEALKTIKLPEAKDKGGEEIKRSLALQLEILQAVVNQGNGVAQTIAKWEEEKAQESEKEEGSAWFSIVMVLTLMILSSLLTYTILKYA